MRTDDEIVARIKLRMRKDLFGFETGYLLLRLSFDKAKAEGFLKPDATPDGWVTALRDRESVLQEMREYMPFAWEKANRFRGISAGRSIYHYMAWIWLLGDENYFGDLSGYEFYGKNELKRICEFYGFESLDDGVRLNQEPSE